VSGCTARLVGAETELSQPGDDVELFGPFGGCCCFLALLDRLPLCCRACFGSRVALVFPRPPSLVEFVVHEFGSERAFRRVDVVTPAQKPNPVHRWLAPARHRLDVIELQEGARRATLTGCADERALLWRGRDYAQLSRFTRAQGG